MKKTIICLAVLTICAAAFFLYNHYVVANEDRTPPVISAKTETITASVTISKEELLKDVSAYDDRDGDVSHTLVIESISHFFAENKRVITYAAIDKNLNVSRLERELIYTDYQEPTFSLDAPLSYVVGSKVDILKNIHAHSTLDGDLSVKIRYGMDTIIDNFSAGKYPIEFRVTDSCGKTAYLNTEIEIFDNIYSGIKVELTKYLTYLPVNSNFKKEAYFKGSNIEGELTILTDVNTKVPGVYYADYYVNGVNTSGKSRLVVVVF